MTDSGARIYQGDVVHVRQRPRVHRLNYKVFSLLIDVDQIERIASQSRWLSYNRRNLVALFDRDHGDGTEPIALHARRLLQQAGLPRDGRRIELLCYPRILGYGFNPLSVYFVSTRDGQLETLIYQVHNTFGERRSYVVSAGEMTNGTYAHGCRKELFVSPFTDGTGSYTFRVRPPGDETLVAVLYKATDGPVLRAHFRGDAQPFSDASLLKAVMRMPLMTMKVTAGIHWEALKIWLKGVPLARRHKSPRFAASLAASAAQDWRKTSANIALEHHVPLPSPGPKA
jgi:uncharacterized protein